MEIHVERSSDGWATLPDDPLTWLQLVAAIALAAWLIYSALAPIWPRSRRELSDGDGEAA